jgi:cell division initiation protein
MTKLKITPLDLQNQEFGRTLRGYDPEEVKVFLELVSDEFELLIKENSSLTERLRDLDEKIKDYRNMEKTLNATLIAAQKNSENYFENAKKEADLILENAHLESRKILEDAHNEKISLEEEIGRLHKSRQLIIRRFKSFLQEHLELLAGEEGSFSDTPVQSENVDADPEISIPVENGFHPTFSVDEGDQQGQEHDGSSEPPVGDTSENQDWGA